MTSGAEVTTHNLVLSVRLMDGRFHGEPEWPPAPARLFQALIAGCGVSQGLDDSTATALRWLETLPAPTIAAPIAWPGQEVKSFVPNNDLDAKGGDPHAVAGIRTAKHIRPRIFDADTPVVYAWPLPDDFAEADCARIRDLSLGLYQLGRGVDMAWANADVLDSAAMASLLERHPGQVHRPTPGGEANGPSLACPEPGSLDSLTARHEATLKRFTPDPKKRIQVFQQPPKAHFAQVGYDSPPERALFEIRPVGDTARFTATPLHEIVQLTTALRDGAAERLGAALPSWREEIERTLIGRSVPSLPRLAPSARVRLIPLPSIGHEHADYGIRRLMVEVPSAAPLRGDDVFWAFSGLTLRSSQGADIVVIRSHDERMMNRYVRKAGGSRTWRTVTPAALPAHARRRRIEPSRQSSEAKNASERAAEEDRAAGAVVQSFRHAGVRAQLEHVRVQREPFSLAGERAETFAAGTRFDKHRLWHVEVTFVDRTSGPLVLGDGRFLGLGLMEAADEREAVAVGGVLCFRVSSGLLPTASSDVIAKSLRRAVMARFEAESHSAAALPPFVSGHGFDGRPQTRGHLYYAFDSDSSQLFVIHPDQAEHSGEARKEQHWTTVDRALEGFNDLRAGASGRLALIRSTLNRDTDPIFAPSKHWVSRTPYVVNRHVKYVGAKAALEADLQASCRGIGLSTPRVEVLEARGVPGIGVTGLAELHFQSAVSGPLLLGKTRHMGGGLFGHAIETPT